MSQKLEIACIHVGAIDTNFYVLHDRGEGAAAVIVDPGGSAPRIISYLKKEGLRPLAILLTHAHDDHTMGAGELCREYPEVRVYLAEAERRMAEDRSLNCGFFDFDETLSPDVWVREGDVLELIGHRFRVLVTPGHTEGSCCYYLEEEGILIAGDTLFHGGCGRTDFPTGSEKEMYKSLERLLTELPEDTEVLPGHGGKTTIGFEKIIEGFGD